MIEKVEATLRGEVETYDDYLTGQVYGYVVRKPAAPPGGGTAEVPADEDEDDDEGEEVDSCWGFYGYDYCVREAKSVAEHAARDLPVFPTPAPEVPA